MCVIITGFVVHVIFLLSIFDIYFKSPIIDGIEVEKNDINPSAKRLILIIADGLRADSFFVLENGTTKTPYLRSVIEKEGVWGVCHARVPTESRPGHVALIAGFYEDPSAVFKGWKENPVEFDSVFNQSETTYSWGSPDIVTMFRKGDTETKVHTSMYGAEMESFSGKNNSASTLNTWVFNEFDGFIKNAMTNVSLSESLNKDAVIIFLHLLGTDVAGHVNKPHSRVYKENIIGLDKGIERVVYLVNEFYKYDNRTAFIFTSDHGMTDWGSHGSGSKCETETPIVAWGAGLSQPMEPSEIKYDTPEDWGLDSLLRRDIQQADLAPLMSVLLGISIPVHSVGTLPMAFLDLTDKNAAEAMFLNGKQLLSHFKRHCSMIEMYSISWLYKPYPDLKQDKEAALIESIRRLISNQQYKEAISESKTLITLVLSGIKYYQNYYQNMLLFSVSCSYIGWIAWLSVQILPHSKVYCMKRTDVKSDRKWLAIDIVFLIILLLLLVVLIVQAFPVQYYVYSCLPVILWWAVARRYSVLAVFFSYIRANISKTLITVIVYGIGIELVVLTFFYRWVLCIVFCGLSVWPLFEKQLKYKNVGVLVMWIVTCLGLAVFPTLPTVGSMPNIKLVVISGWLWLIAGLILIINQIRLFKNKEDCLLLVFQLSLFPITIWLVSSTADSYEANLGLPALNQILSWILLIICPLAPFVGSTKVLPRLAAISLSLAVPFLLLSIGHEGIFILILMANLFTWITLERVISGGKGWEKEIRRGVQERLAQDDFRRAFFFKIVYTTLSFFGTANIASINSFDPVWVRCFLTVFAPFTKTTLILLKLLVPFLLVSCSFQALNIIAKAWSNEVFVIMLITSDIVGSHFLYAVTNEGSWLEIGTSISHYVIMQVMILFIVLLYSVANFYMQASFWCTLQSKTAFLPGQSLESRAVSSRNRQCQHSWSIFDKRHAE